MKIVYRSRPFNMHGYIAVTVKYSNGTRKTVLEHREVMERHLKRRLKPSEVVHHKDGNKINNRLRNLEVISRSQHSSRHAKERGIEIVALTCRECDASFHREAREERHNRGQGKAGPFCGRSCAGSWSGKNRKRKPVQIKHGTNNTYDYRKCRCRPCTEAHRKAVRVWRGKSA